MPLPEYKQLVDEAKREIKEIDPAELKRMQAEKQNFTLLDVREPDEVAEGAIAGSKPLPRGQLEYKIDTIPTDKNQPIVCYCGGGGRSALAPRATGNPATPADQKKLDNLDYMLISRGHSDHFGDAVELAKKHNPKVVSIYELCTFVQQKGAKQIAPMNKGGTQQVGDIKVT